jgi:hypothetical protein
VKSLKHSSLIPEKYHYFPNTTAYHIVAFVPSWHVFQNSIMLEMGALGFTTNHYLPFPIPQYRGIGILPSAVSAAQTNYIMRCDPSAYSAYHAAHVRY